MRTCTKGDMMTLKKKALKAWGDYLAEVANDQETRDQESCQSATRSFVRLTGCEGVPVCWVNDHGVTMVKYDGVTFLHARNPHAWWMEGNCPICGENGLSASFKEDGLWYVGQMLEEFEIAGHTCPEEEVEKLEGELTAAEQLKEAVTRIIKEAW